MAYDDIIVGGGHNALTAAAYLARAGRRVLVLEKRGDVGGAAVSAPAFPGVDANLSRYAYLVSLVPREIIADLHLDVHLVRRRFSSYTPHPDDPARGLLIDNAEPDATDRAIRAITGDGDAASRRSAFGGRIARMAGRVWPTVLQPLVAGDDMRAMVDDDDLWRALTQVPLGALIARWFPDDLLAGIVATDGLIGTFASLDDASLLQNVCFLYHVVGGGSGDWDVPVGGMGAVSGALARAAVAAGATIVTGAEAMAATPDGTVAWREADGVHTARADTVLAGCAPAVFDRLLAAAGAEPLGGESSDGAQLKVNMLLTRLPRLRDDAVDPSAAFAGTFHINESRRQLEAAFAEARAGRVPSLPPCEIYCHTLSDRSILGVDLAATDAQTLTLFALHMPASLFRGRNEKRRTEALGAVLRSLNSVLAEPIEPLLMRDGQGALCLEARTPVDLEDDLDLPGGNIFHRPLRWPWAEHSDEVGTWGVETRYPNVLICGAGARRGGGVSGIPGHNAAQAVLTHR